MYSIEEIAMLIETGLNDELRRREISGSITLYSLGSEISLFYENNGSRYFFFFPVKIDMDRKFYFDKYPVVIDPIGIINHIKEKLPKIDISYIV